MTLPSSFTVEFPGTVMPGTVTVNVDAQTAFEDETAAPPFSLDDLNGGGSGGGGDYVIVKGTEVGNEINATLVKRVDAEDKLANLLGRAVIAAEEDHSTHQGMLKHLPFIREQLRACKVHH